MTLLFSFGFEKTIMKFNKLGMSSARLENVLVAPLRDCVQEMFFILALLTIVNQFRELSQSILEFDTPASSMSCLMTCSIIDYRYGLI